MILYCMIRFRRRSPGEVGADIEGNNRLEVTWIVIPTVIGLLMFFWGADLYFTMYRTRTGGLQIYVIAKQWMWKIQHQTGQREINMLHIPVNRDIRLTLGSEDVIHSFFVPEFRIKADVIPGHYRTLWFRATRTGRYHLFCAEYCGTSHSHMGGWVQVMAEADYQAWLATGGADQSLSAKGQGLFLQLGCAVCHRNDSQGRAPVLDGLYQRPVLLTTGQVVTADESYLRESILYPAAKIVAGFEPLMPTFQGLLSEEQIVQLIAYVKSLRAQPDSRSGLPARQDEEPAP
jgi:cytochrome c oxidase subunit 2